MLGREHERLLRTTRAGGADAFDKTLWGGKLVTQDAQEPSTLASKRETCSSTPDAEIKVPAAEDRRVTLARS